jgi:hypothetical protein
MLQRIAATQTSPPAPLQVSWGVERTVFLEALMHEVEQSAAACEDLVALDPKDVLLVGESLEVLRKKVLLRLLARREADRLSLDVRTEEVQRTADAFRRELGLAKAEDTQHWLHEQTLNMAEFTNLMRDVCLLEKLERVYARDIDAGLADQVRLASARLRQPPSD